MFCFRILVASVVSALFTSNAWATTYYVRTSGNDANAGTSATMAFKTIKKAADVALAGDTIYVGAGIYTDDVGPNNNGTVSNPVKCVADATGVYTGDAGIVDLRKRWNQGSKDYWQIDGLKVSTDSGNAGIDLNGCAGFVAQNCTLTGRKQGIKVAGTTTAKITNCIIAGNVEDGIEVNSGNAATTIDVSNCRIQTNTKCGIYFKKASGTIKNCLITNNSDHGIWADNDASTLPTIWNCTVSHNLDDGVRTSGGTTVIRNSAVTNNGVYGLNRSGGTVTNSYNDVHGNATGNYNSVTAGTNAISSNPLYTDATNGDFSFARTSPLIDAGTNASGTVDDDLDSRLRPIGPSWDIGCYEGAPNGKILLVATSTTTPTANEVARRLLIQSFGCEATLIDDDATQTSYNTQLALNDIAYIPSDIYASSLATKLNAATIPIVNENTSYCDDLGFCASASNSAGASVSIAMSKHFITSPFGEGSLTIFNSSQANVILGGAASKDMQRLATWGDSAGLAVLDTGSRRYDSGSVSARRVQLPWGGSGFGIGALNSSGQTMMKRAILWAGGLVGYWTLDATSGTTAADSSGYDNNGSLQGGISFSANSVSPAKLSNGLNFDGIDDYVSIPNSASLQPTSALSISAWIKGDAWDSGGYVNVVLRKGAANPNNYQLAICDGVVALFLDDSDTGGIRGSTVLSAGTWYHVVATWDGATAKVYVNGVLDNGAGAARAGTIGTDAQTLNLGGRPGSDDCFDGVLDDVRLFNYALDVDEIKNLRLIWQPRGMRIISWVEIQ